MNRSSSNMRASGDRIVSGRFQLVRQLGEGGMGVVWEALDIATGQPRAIKLVHPDATDANAHPRFVREAEVLRGIAHPNVVRIFEIARDDDHAPAIVMELLRGESLAARIEREKTLSVGQTCAILSRVTAAVAAAHAAGIIHRDLKPDNVFVVNDSARGVVDVRVLDFGVARKIESTPDKLTKTGTLIGTPYYMSPEQASGLKDLDGRSDVWSLAVIAFECLTGKMPIRAENYGQLLMQIVQLKTLKVVDLRPDVPKTLADAIDAAFVDRETRIGTGELASVFAGLADHAIAPPPAAPAAPTSTRTLRMGPAAPSTPRALASAKSNPLDAPTLIDPHAPKPARGRSMTFAIASLSLLALGGAGVVYRARIKADTDTKPPLVSTAPSTTPTLSTAAVSTPEPSSEPAAPPQPAVSTQAVSSPSASASSAKKAPPKPVVSAASTGHVTPPPTTTDRLQGGVGGNVPF